MATSTHVWKITPTGGSQLDLNDRKNTFLCLDHSPGVKATTFKEARNFAGGIRQNNKHHPLVKMKMPMFVVGSGDHPEDDLYDRLVAIRAACLVGGSAVYQAPGEPSQTFTLGASDEPDYKHDYLYVYDHIATLSTLELWRMP